MVVVKESLVPAGVEFCVDLGVALMVVPCCVGEAWMVLVGVGVRVAVGVFVGVAVFVAVGGVPLTLGVKVGVGVPEGVTKIGSKVQVGALVRVGASVKVGSAVRLGVGETKGVSVKVVVMVAVNIGEGILVGDGLRNLRYGGSFSPGMEYPKYVKAKPPMHATPSNEIRNRMIFCNQFSPEDFLGCSDISIILHLLQQFYFCRLEDRPEPSALNPCKGASGTGRNGLDTSPAVSPAILPSLLSHISADLVLANCAPVIAYPFSYIISSSHSLCVCSLKPMDLC